MLMNPNDTMRLKLSSPQSCGKKIKRQHLQTLLSSDEEYSRNTKVLKEMWICWTKRWEWNRMIKRIAIHNIHAVSLWTLRTHSVTLKCWPQYFFYTASILKLVNTDDCFLFKKPLDTVNKHLAVFVQIPALCDLSGEALAVTVIAPHVTFPLFSQYEFLFSLSSTSSDVII